MLPICGIFFNSSYLFRMSLPEIPHMERITSNDSTLCSQLYADSDFSDVTLVCGDNQHLPAHRAVLCASSTFLRQLLYDSQNQRTFLYLGPVPFEDLRSLLELMYMGSCYVQRERRESVMALAVTLGLEGVLNKVEEFAEVLEEVTEVISAGEKENQVYQEIACTETDTNNLLNDKRGYRSNEQKYNQEKQHMSDKLNILVKDDTDGQIRETLNSKLGTDLSWPLRNAVEGSVESDFGNKIGKDRGVDNILIAKQNLKKRVKTCPECLQDIGSRNLTKHRKENQSCKKYLRKKILTCPVCQKKVGNGNRSRHMKEYHNKETYACARCSKVFVRKRSLIDHAQKGCRMDQNIFPVYCENKCGKMFRDTRSMKNHIRTGRCPITLKYSEEIEIEIREGCKIKMSEVGNFLLSQNKKAVYQGML